MPVFNPLPILITFLVGFGGYYLSRDSDEVKFDKNLHTKAKLYEILEDIYLEYGCAYIFYYNTILNMKEKNILTDEKLESIKAQIENYTQ